MPNAEATSAQGYAGQFYDAAQRHRADSLGMWLFLATEAMLFSGLFAALLVYRIMHPAAAKEVSLHFQLWIAALNTAVLLTSSFAVAAARVLLRHSRRGWASGCLAITAMLGVLFLILKTIEYHIDIRDGIVPAATPSLFQNPSATLFIDLYYAATGLHAVHLAIGVIWIAALAIVASRKKAFPHTPVHLAGLYWHFVDVVWIFLFPTLYLVGRSGP